MAIHEPGRRLMHAVPLKYVQKKVQGGGARGVNPPLNLTSMIDYLVTVVVFLLMTFSASGELPIDKNVKLPKAENTLDMLTAPMVSVNGTQILVDGRTAGSTRDIGGQNQVTRIDGLFSRLKEMREGWTSLQGGKKPFPGVCILQVDQQVPAIVVKSVFRTAVDAGYANVSFMVGQIPRTGGGGEH